ncbi:Gamma-tubulin complex component 2 [Galemys pyrenaicus]|uniref:Gamma-tubulin complex component 2 n=1 Tax=Galemys pyrenaicus TaxID=202257 RepID=A0A8J6AAH4_GALPY|nr:Gamma-tubulin complex component 2 [Galemys pyrenaicus]
MSEFRIHHDVNELLSLLRVPGGEGAEVYIDLLQRNRTPYVTTSVSAHGAKVSGRTRHRPAPVPREGLAAQVKIAEFSRTPEDFLKKYDELKSKNTRNLDPLTLQYLQQNAKERAELAAMAAGSSTPGCSAPAPTSRISAQELEELRKQLGSVATGSTLQQSLELTRKLLRDKQSKKNSGQHLPVFPAWVYERPTLLGDFLASSGLSTDNAVPIGSLSLAAQESALVEDLLYVLVGVDGRYVTAQPLTGRQGRTFLVDPNLDLSIKELVSRILPVAASYSTVTRFTEEKSSFEYGQVNHALAAAMRTLLKEYLILVTQLEQLQRQGLLSLQKLWFYVQPAMRTMDILASLATAVDKGECGGGSTLSLLHDRSLNYTGDSQAQELCLFLTKAASVPYFEMLERWIYRGIINDPYSEFMVEEHELRKETIREDYNDKYWDQRYTVAQRQVPSFLQKMAGKVLSTGKYLNVVRECGHDVTCPEAKEIVYTLKERAYVEQIEKAFNYASKVLLDFLLQEQELLAHLRSIKRYFLMDQGDFFVHFMDLTEEELKKPVDDIAPPRLEALLELALRMSTANTDPFKDDLEPAPLPHACARLSCCSRGRAGPNAVPPQIDLMPHDLITQLLRVLAIETKQEKAMAQAEPSELALSGLEAFSFDYVVKWPLSLIINRKALTRYQMLFRHMFYCKHVERRLCGVWLSSRAAKQSALRSASWFAGAFTLRQRMLNFVQNIQYYMMFEVMEPTWHVLEKNLRSAANIDDVLGHHTGFLDSCLKDCMLTNPELLRVFSKLLSVCVMFTNCMQRFTQSMRLDAELGRLSLERGPMLGPPTEPELAEERARKEPARKVRPARAGAPGPHPPPSRLGSPNCKPRGSLAVLPAPGSGNPAGPRLAGASPEAPAWRVRGPAASTPAPQGLDGTRMAHLSPCGRCSGPCPVTGTPELWSSRAGGRAGRTGRNRGPPWAWPTALRFQHLAQHADAPQLAAGFEATISKFDENFSAHLLDLLARLSVYSTSDCEHGMASVISRLDFNGFYAQRLERLSAERSQRATPTGPGPRGAPAQAPRVTIPTQPARIPGPARLPLSRRARGPGPEAGMAGTGSLTLDSSLPPAQGLYPESVSYVLGARGHNFTLHLRKNRDLVGSGYVETYTAADGSQLTEQPPVQDHCLYQGRVEGHPESAASLSTCAGLRWGAEGAGTPGPGPTPREGKALSPCPGLPAGAQGLGPRGRGRRAPTSALGPRGFFQVGHALHLIEPLDGAGEAGPHALYEAEQLPPSPGTCGVSDASLEHALGPRVSAALRPRNRPLSRETRYVELYVVADKAEFQAAGSRPEVRRRVLEVVNHVDKLYRELNVRVVLVGLEIWNDRDKIDVSPSAEATLDSFLAWRASDLALRHQHDNAQLITGIDFIGATVGLAKVSAMCSGASGAVNQDHHRHPVGVASTMAHEMGHNLGMDHDQNVQGCYCPVPTEDGGCIMAATLSAKFPKRFSQCSQADLETFVEKRPAACLGNLPDLDRLVGGPVCGNQFLERGEQCDCGKPQVQGRPPPLTAPGHAAARRPTASLGRGRPRAAGLSLLEVGGLLWSTDLLPAAPWRPQECRDRCCNATTCQLVAGAECAQGACCQDCKTTAGSAQVKPAGEPCRPAKDACDLAEHCDGQRPACPEDVFRENGTPCPGGYCYEGDCPTLAGRCRELWGPGPACAARPVLGGGRPASWERRPTANPQPAQGRGPLSSEPSVGRRVWGGARQTGHSRLSSRADRCGVLFCEGGQIPPGRRSCTFTSGAASCQALGLDTTGYEPVPVGTKCGEDKVCWRGQCQGVQVYRRSCSSTCSHRGVCNHKGQCHCQPGWAPPDCAQQMTHARPASGSLAAVLVPTVLLAVLALVLAQAVIRRKLGRSAQGGHRGLQPRVPGGEQHTSQSLHYPPGPALQASSFCSDPEGATSCVMLAEIVKFFLPRLVDLHNYVPTCSTDRKLSNWSVLNRQARPPR